jgi:cytochrome c biogenesis protein CcmG, thiol:disulfide interchange protein DsbE
MRHLPTPSRVLRGVRIRAVAALAAALSVVPAAALAVPQPGQPVPALSLPSPDGKTISLATLHGKPVYLNFFASWCGPCNEEAPSIGVLRRKYEPRGLQVIGIDELDAPGEAAKFQKKYADPYSLVGIDDSGTTGRTFGAVAMPVHVFIDRYGTVRTFRIGEMNSHEIEAAIKELLN